MISTRNEIISTRSKNMCKSCSNFLKLRCVFVVSLSGKRIFLLFLIYFSTTTGCYLQQYVNHVLSFIGIEYFLYLDIKRNSSQRKLAFSKSPKTLFHVVIGSKSTIDKYIYQSENLRSFQFKKKFYVFFIMYIYC